MAISMAPSELMTATVTGVPGFANPVPLWMLAAGGAAALFLFLK